MMDSTPERKFGGSLVDLLGLRLWDLEIQFILFIGLLEMDMDGEWFSIRRDHG